MKLWSFASVQKHLKPLQKDNPHEGFGLLRLFKCLLLQFMEDLSDRELARFLQENNAGKWFCGFSLVEKTPGFTVFTKVAHDKQKDRWYSHLRAPYERVFSQREKRLRYCGTAKNQFAAFMEAICFNLKRLTVLDPPNLVLS